MALLRLPEGQQRSGKQGGVVFSHNRGGPYVRSRAVPVNPMSSRQIAVRNNLQNLAIHWNNTLTQAQRDGWGVYAQNLSWQNRLGEAIVLTGANMYLRSNAAVLQAGLTRIDDAPTIYTLATAEQALVPSAAEATQDLSIAYDDTAAWCSEDGAAELIYMGLPKNTGVNYFSGPYRLLKVILGNSTTPPTSPEAAIATVFPFAQNNAIWIRSRILRADGRLSTFAQSRFLAGA